MKILLVTQAYFDSFPPRNLSMASAVRQADQLSRIYSVRVLTVGRPKPVETPHRNLRIESVPGWLLPDPVNYIISWPLLVRFVTMVKADRPDIVLVSKHMFFSSFVIVLAKLMHLKVVTAVDTFPGIIWFPRSKMVGAVMWVYARLIGLPLLRLSDKVILFYEGLLPTARRYHLNAVVIPNGIPVSQLAPLPPPPDLIKPDHAFWVGFVGRAESIKGFDIALRAADILVDHPDIKFVFVGGNQHQTSSGNKIFLGFRPDVSRIYQLFDCLIVPSFSEGLPNVIMEAMAQRIPVIASSVGGIGTLIRTGINGLLLPPGNPDLLAGAVLKLYKDHELSLSLGKSARLTIAKYFNWSKILISYKRLFHDLCAA